MVTSPESRRRELGEIYDDAGGAAWNLVVYQSLHAGWEMTNIGGRAFLDSLAERFGPLNGCNVLEIGSGLGANCQYLAAVHGCAVEGVEVNSVLVRQARERLGALPPDGDRRVTFTEADSADWRPTRSYDLAYILESLVLMSDYIHVLAALRDALRAGGALGLGELLAGPLTTPEIRRRLLEQDGMVTLLTPSQYRAALLAAGFCQVHMVDQTNLARTSFARIDEALRHHADSVIADEGPEGYHRWRELTEYYRDRFAEREVLYFWIYACKDRGGNAGVPIRGSTS